MKSEKDRTSHQDVSEVRDRPRKRGRLPCGSRVCVRCHRGCGVVMSAYLSGLDENQEVNGNDLRDSDARDKDVRDNDSQ